MVGETELKSSLLSKSNLERFSFLSFSFFGEVFENRFPTPFYALFPLLIQNLLGVEPCGVETVFSSFCS